MPNSIKLKNYSGVFEEYVATAAAITPGMLLEKFYSGTTLQVRAHSTAGGNAEKIFALEDELQGNGITDNYAVSVPIQCWFPGRGDQVYAILADDNVVVIGDFLESDGNGRLQLHTSDVESFESAEAGSITVLPEQIVAVAIEALDLTGDSSAESSESPLGVSKRLRVRIL